MRARIRRHVAEGLVRVVQRLGVHVLVQRAKPDEVAQSFILGLAREALEGEFENVGEIGARRAERRKRKVPASVVRHVRGIVERVGVRQELFARASFAQTPVLLEPADVADLPERRVDDGELRPEQALAVEPGRDVSEVIPVRDEI